MRKFRDDRLYDRGTRFIWAKLRDEHGVIQRLSTRCTTEKAASAWCDEYERKAADPSYKRAADATLATAVAEHVDQLRRKKVSPATLEIAETKLGHFVRLWSEDWPLSRIDNDLVLQFIDTREGEGRTAHTVKKELDELKRALTWAKFRGTFPRELATVFPPGYSSKHKPRDRWLPYAELMALLRELDEDRAAHVAFIVATGARRGESFRARREDVHLDVDNPHVNIRGTKTERAKGSVPVTGLTHPLLVFALDKAPGRDLLFRPWGKMVRDLAAACRRAGIARASANDLRRTYGWWHRLAGTSPSDLGVMLRHSTDKLAQTTYANVSGADLGPQLRKMLPIGSSGSVSILYGATGPKDPNTPQPEGDPPLFSSVPGAIRTRDPRFRKPSVASCENLSESRLLGPAAEHHGRQSVRHLNGHAWVHEATANLLALLAGVGS